MSVTVTAYVVDWEIVTGIAAKGEGAGPIFEAFETEPDWLVYHDDEAFVDSAHAAIDLREAADALAGKLDAAAHATLDLVAAVALGEGASPRELDAAIVEEMELAAAASPATVRDLAARVAGLDHDAVAAAWVAAGSPAPQGVLTSAGELADYLRQFERLFIAAAAAGRGILILTA